MTVSVYCINCGAMQDPDIIQWSVGPQSMKFSSTCPGCGRAVTVKSETWEFIIQQMEINNPASER